MIGDWVQIIEPSKYAGAIGCIKTLIDHKDNENAYFKVFCGDVWHLELEGFIEIGFTYSNGKGVLWGAKIKSNYPISIVNKFVIPNITCLHELQHAMKLCRIDKKFEL